MGGLLDGGGVQVAAGLPLLAQVGELAEVGLEGRGLAVLAGS